MTWYAGTCSMSLIYKLYNMIKYVCYMSLGLNDCFMANADLTCNHYRMNNISGVPEVGLSCVTNVMYGSVQYPRHWCFIIGSSG